MVLGAVAACRAEGLNPRIDLICASLGANDVLAGECQPFSVGRNIAAAMDALLSLATEVGCDVAQARCVACLPSLSVQASVNRLTLARQSILDSVSKLSFGRTADMTGLSTIGDGLHPDTGGIAALARFILEGALK